MTVIDYDVPVIDFVWNFHGKFFPHHFTDTVTFYTYLDILLRVHGSASQGRLYKHCVIPGLYSCTQCTHPGYCDADRVTPGGGTRAMPRMSRNGWYLIRAPTFLITWSPGPGHWTFQSRCRDHSVSGHRTDIGLNGHNLIIVMRPDSPCQDFRHTSIWFLTFSLKWCYNHLTWWWLLWHHCYCNHIEPLLLIILIQLCFTFRWIGRWWG